MFNAWHSKGAWCLHLVCIWKDINFYSPACIVSGYMAKMTCHGLPYVLGRNCDLTKHLNGKTEIALCLALQFGVAWRLKGIRSESCCNWKGHLQRFPPSTVCYLLTADWLASIWHEARCKIEKQFYQRQNQTYLHNFTDRKQHKSCLTPMQSCLVWFPLENTFSLTLCNILPKNVYWSLIV